ncbi:MAG: hypothetical protein CL878_03285 [Dehalococcoidia bacterium]|nr:hypothetical protein [Dehalococcoidia bacterium]
MEFLISLLSQFVRNFTANLHLVLLFGAYLLLSHLVERGADRKGRATAAANLTTWVGVGALVGGRLAYALPSLDQYVAHPADLLRVNTGLSFYGALVGGLVVGSWYGWRHQEGFWWIADLYGLYTPLAIMLTRFGCLLHNTCYGIQAPPPLGIRFPGFTQPRYPAELYAGLLALLLFGVLLWLSQRHLAPGTLFLAFLGGYPLARALVDLTRIDLGSQWGMGDPVLSVGVALAAATLWWLRRRRVGGGSVPEQ